MPWGAAIKLINMIFSSGTPCSLRTSIAIVALPPVAETVVPVNFPKTGHMTEQMAKIAASDIASRLTSLNPHKFELSAKCVLDMGDTGAYMSVSPVRPPRNQIPKVSDGRQWLYAKKAFEQIYLWHASRGLRLPTNLGW